MTFINVLLRTEEGMNHSGSILETEEEREKTLKQKQLKGEFWGKSGAIAYSKAYLYNLIDSNTIDDQIKGLSILSGIYLAAAQCAKAKRYAQSTPERLLWFPVRKLVYVWHIHIAEKLSRRVAFLERKYNKVFTAEQLATRAAILFARRYYYAAAQYDKAALSYKDVSDDLCVQIYSRLMGDEGTTEEHECREAYRSRLKALLASVMDGESEELDPASAVFGLRSMASRLKGLGHHYDAARYLGRAQEIATTYGWYAEAAKNTAVEDEFRRIDNKRK